MSRLPVQCKYRYTTDIPISRDLYYSMNSLYNDTAACRSYHSIECLAIPTPAKLTQKNSNNFFESENVKTPKHQVCFPAGKVNII